jgi:TPR repeat protein
LSAEKRNPDRQFPIACIAENGIALFAAADLFTTVRYCDRCCDLSTAGAASFGWSFEAARGVSVDFTAAAEYFKKAADSDHPDGVNCFGCCLEDGRGVDPDIDRAVSHDGRAASLGHPDALLSLGRSLESGKGIGRDPPRPAKYLRLSAEKKNTAAQNSFGFCLEHGRGVEQTFEMAARYDKLAINLGHSEGETNCARCLPLLGRWKPPDRSSETVSHPPSPDRFAEFFRPFLENHEPLDDDRHHRSPVPTLAHRKLTREIHRSSELRWARNQTRSP